MSKDTMDQAKLIDMIKRTLKTAEQLQNGHYKNAILGSLEAILDESQKPLLAPLLFTSYVNRTMQFIKHGAIL